MRVENTAYRDTPAAPLRPWVFPVQPPGREGCQGLGQLSRQQSNIRRELPLRHGGHQGPQVLQVNKKSRGRIWRFEDAKLIFLAKSWFTGATEPQERCSSWPGLGSSGKRRLTCRSVSSQIFLRHEIFSKLSIFAESGVWTNLPI